MNNNGWETVVNDNLGLADGQFRFLRPLSPGSQPQCSNPMAAVSVDVGQLSWLLADAYIHGKARKDAAHFNFSNIVQCLDSGR